MDIAEKSVTWVESVFVESIATIVVWLITAVLAGVEEEEVSELSKGTFAVKLHVGTFRERCRPERHHFIVGLVSVGAAKEKLRRGDSTPFGSRIGVVVIDLMIIPSEEPGAGGMHRLEILVGAVLRIADAVVIERFDLSSEVAADLATSATIFVDVVTEVKDEIGRVLFHLLVGRKKPLFPMLARGDSEAEFFGCRIWCGKSAGTADRAGRTAGFEAKVKPGISLEVFCLDVDGKSKRRASREFARAGDFFESVVFGNFPSHCNRGFWHAAAGFKRFWSETSPENNALVIRIARSDAERKGIISEGDFFRTPSGLTKQRDGGESCSVAKKETAREAPFMLKG